MEDPTADRTGIRAPWTIERSASGWGHGSLNDRPLPPDDHLIRKDAPIISDWIILP